MRPWIALLILAGCAVNPVAPEQEIKTDIVQMYVHLTARDWTAFAAHFLDNAIVIRGTSILPIRDFIETNRKALEGNTPFEEHSDSVEVRIHRDTASAWSRFQGTFGERRWGGYDVFTLVRKDGRWKIASIAVSTE